ncbi:alpha-glucosidase [Acidicapsa dinghuensis]|uniref:Alpha-glucosidase n=1 Tax=Acidicapsa dinghuensis TaxID=2218256 RepID=A0ABW1EF88_9BACT|nr:alpha-glucosidase [Acidicapsa dinghuensis]
MRKRQLLTVLLIAASTTLLAQIEPQPQNSHLTSSTTEPTMASNEKTTTPAAAPSTDAFTPENSGGSARGGGARGAMLTSDGSSSHAGRLVSQAEGHHKDTWFDHAVLYEIYPRSFQDSNGDGIGDINGITSRLDYLHDLGIGAIWITPMYPSPGVDYGYDISNYTAIDPEYGTMADFDRMVAAAKQRHIRVIMDYVINHTSDQHQWFLDSRSSKDNPKRDWYIWRDAKIGPDGKRHPPNNWQSWFGGSAWTWDEKTQQYYYHYFYVQQPDLNWRNPQVRKAMYDVLRFWMDKGVAGFRIDAVSRLFEDPELRDDPYLPGYNAYGDRNIQHKYTDDLPEVHDVLREVRNVVNAYPGDPVLVTEADEPNITQLTKMYGNGDEVQLPMDFQIADLNELSAPKFRELFNQIESNTAHGQPEYFFSNHDQRRQWDRYGDGVHNDQIARLMAALLLTTRGTPQMYYGEEIGMRTTDPARIEDVHDPIGKLGWPKEKGRDGERTPMQWTPGPQSGFTTNPKPWLPIPPSAGAYNVETESKNPDSIYNTYKRLLALRKSEPALRTGEYQAIDENNQHVFSYLRKSQDETILIALNMSAQKHTIDAKEAGSTAEVLYRSPLGPHGLATETLDLNKVTLEPFGFVVAKVK